MPVYELDRETLMRLGRDAETVLNSEAMAVAFQMLEDEATEKLLGTEPGDTETREQLYHRIRALRDIRSRLYTMVESMTLDREEMN